MELEKILNKKDEDNIFYKGIIGTILKLNEND
jgi:hypothetical protein